MKRYQFLYALLFAGMLCTFTLSSTPVLASSTTIELSSGEPSTDMEILKVAAEETQQSYSDLMDGYRKGSVTVTRMNEDCYCVVYGPASSDFIIIETLEED